MKFHRAYRVHDLLSTQKHGGNETEAPICALHGMGGCGKTRLAIEYARRFGPAQYRGGIFWLKASDPRGLAWQFQSILAVLGHALDDPHASEDQVRQQLSRALIDQSARGPVL